jgi:DGQHR domain-containing protein
MSTPSELRLPALELRQGRDRLLYGFAIDGKLLPSFASISRLARGDDYRILGYQRPEVGSHIAEIRRYLESENPLLPNAIVVAFDASVCFEPTPDAGAGADSRPGTLVIPLDPEAPPDRKPGWVVDGQQRLAAIREATVERFPVWVIGFVAQSEREQRDQFILVNNTKPLPKGLIYELLPATEGRLPTLLQRRRFPTHLLQRLNQEADSPFRRLIRTPTTPGGFVSDTAVIKMLENSLSDGVLFRLKLTGGEAEDSAMLAVLKDYWSAVAEVFKHAWRLPPKRSRLMHGAGVIGMGFVMDAIADRLQQAGPPTREQFQADLGPLREVCRWTDGHWDFGAGTVRKWNEIQNTPKDIQMLANHLLVKYKALVWNPLEQGRH